MKKTLLICGNYPLPEDHGSPLRTMAFVRFFMKHGRVDIAYSQTSPGAQKEASVFSNELFLKKRDFGRNFRDRILMLKHLRKMPLPVLELCRDSESALLSMIEAHDYDYIIVRYLNNTSVLFKLPQKFRVRAIVDFDDVLSGSLYDAMLDSVKGPCKRAILTVNKKFLINYERKCLGFGAALFCSNKDRARFVGNGQGGKAFVVPNIYENQSFDDYDFGDGSRNRNILLFVGALGYGPNIQGLKWFMKSIFPDFRGRCPDAQLLVVGRSPKAEFSKFCTEEAGVEFYPDVPDVKEYYKRCRAVIVPLLAGGGTRIKILEAALANRPVLSTPIGAEGLALARETDLLLFENAQEFFVQYNKLLYPERYHSFVQNARKVVLTRYSANEFNRAMEGVLRGLEDRRQALPIGHSTRDIHDRIS